MQIVSLGILYGQAYDWGHSVLKTHFLFSLKSKNKKKSHVTLRVEVFL